MARTHCCSAAGSAGRSVAVVEPESDGSLDGFACPNPDCCDFNRFGVGNLSVSDWIGKGQAIRRLYCSTCKKRFSERKGSLMEDAKLPEDVVVRIVKCLGHGCSIEATADICEVDPRTVKRYTTVAGRRAEDFHQLQLERLEQPPAVVELDELHGRVSRPPQEKKGRRRKRRR
jgi:transposase-like protein